jgi:hypothetical protein
VATAQVEAWVGVHRGSIDEVARVIDASLADAALGRMMLHRRRAITASVISEFFARIGSQFHPYLQGRVASAPSDPADELMIATKAGDIVGNICGTPPPLLFERALLAEADGRLGDAQADLKQVLAAYPGFLSAAVAAARVASAAGDPGQAIRSLASVERELIHTREGAALLADAIRTVGLHEAASRYDLAALVCPGYYDSRGNDCAPADVTGKIANDDRMPQIYYFESQTNGDIICNARGVYYRVNPLFGGLLLAFKPGQTLSTFRSLGVRRTSSRKGAVSEAFELARARLQLLRGRFPAALIMRKVLVKAWWPLRRFLVAAFGLFTRIIQAAVILLYRWYRRLPMPVRARANRYVRFLIRRFVPHLRYSISPLFPNGKEESLLEISEQHMRWRLAQARYETGVAQIFGLQMRPVDIEVAHRLVSVSQSWNFYDALPEAGGLRMPEPGQLPPLAEDVLRRLVSEAGARRPASPQS